MYLAFKNLIISTKNKSNVVRNPKAKYEWCFSRLNFSKTSAADAVTTWTAKNYGNNVFERKQKKRRYRLTYLEVSKKEKTFHWYFEHQTPLSKLNVTVLVVVNKEMGVCLVSLDCKLTQKRTIVYAFSSWNERKR